jgi:hypothetical protein
MVVYLFGGEGLRDIYQVYKIFGICKRVYDFGDFCGNLAATGDVFGV